MFVWVNANVKLKSELLGYRRILEEIEIKRRPHNLDLTETKYYVYKKDTNAF